MARSTPIEKHDEKTPREGLRDNLRKAISPCFNGPALDPDRDEEAVEWIAQIIANRAIERMNHEA